MTSALLLHGNPGTPEDFETLRAHLPVPAQASPRPRGASLAELIADLDRQIERAGSETAVIAFSWACYLALHHARAGQRKPERLVLVNPYLCAENPLSAVAAFMVGLPVVGPALLRRSIERRVGDFVTGMFAPAPVPPEIASSLEYRLRDVALWQAAVSDKRLQQAHPLPRLERAPCPLVIVRGAEDRSAPWERQAEILGGALAEARVVTIAGAGHALPWTHPAEIASALDSHRSAA